MIWVLDASAAVKLLVDEPGSDKVRAIMTPPGGLSPEFAAPAHMLLEVLGVLAKRHAAGKVDIGRIEHAPEALEDLVDVRALDASLVNEANRLSIRAARLLGTKGDGRPFPANIFDCAYIALALAEQATLLTADKRQAGLAAEFGCDCKLIDS